MRYERPKLWNPPEADDFLNFAFLFLIFYFLRDTQMGTRFKSAAVAPLYAFAPIVRSEIREAFFVHCPALKFSVLNSEFLVNKKNNSKLKT